MRVWGDKLPSSVVRAAQQRLKHVGLESDLAALTNSKLSEIRATGKRFRPAERTEMEYSRCIRDALGLGGGYVELWEPEKGVIDEIRRRRLDLDVLAIAPLAPSSASLVRSHTSGACLCCMGTGSVAAFDETLVVGRPGTDPTAEH